MLQFYIKFITSSKIHNMEHQQSAHGLTITIALLALVAIIIATAFYLSFIRKNKTSNSGHH